MLQTNLKYQCRLSGWVTTEYVVEKVYSKKVTGSTREQTFRSFSVIDLSRNDVTTFSNFSPIS